MRIEQEEWQEWNMMIAMLLSVTTGYITKNMRFIGLKKESHKWILEVVLENKLYVDVIDSPDDEKITDEEWIDEFFSDFHIMCEDNIEGKLDYRVIINENDPLPLSKYDGYETIIYQRKENSSTKWWL